MNTHSISGSRDNIRVNLYDVDTRGLSRRNAHELLRQTEPEHTITSHNTACIGLDRLRAVKLNAGLDTLDDKIAKLAVGTGTDTPTYANELINNEQKQLEIIEYETDGTDVIVNTVLGSEELNDLSSDITECGLISDSGRLLNHSLFSSFEKTARRAATFQVTLSFRSDLTSTS